VILSVLLPRFFAGQSQGCMVAAPTTTARRSRLWFSLFKIGACLKAGHCSDVLPMQSMNALRSYISKERVHE